MKNLIYVVELVRMDLNRYDTFLYQKILQYAILGYRELQLGVNRNVNVMYATPNDAYIIPLPDDFEWYTKIGINLGGKVYTLSLNPNMPLNRKLDDCGQEVSQTISACGCGDTNGMSVFDWGFAFVPHFRSGQYVGEFYGQGGGVNPLGYFRIDETYRQIQFQNVPKTEMYIEYVSTGATNGNTLIPSMAVQVIRAYIHWQLLEHKSRTTAVDKQRKQDEYKTQMQEYRIKNLTLTIDDFLDATYLGRKYAAKF